MGDEAVKIARPDEQLSRLSVRLDAYRDTRILVQRNVNKHIHITLGREQVTLILHPHMAGRLAANILSVLKGEEMAHD